MAKGLERFGGDREAYFNVLRSYAANTPSLLEQMKGVTAEGLSGYAVTVHGVKGSSGGIGADAIGERAGALEKAAVSGDFTFVSENNAGFIQDVFTLISELEDIAVKSSAAETDVVKPKKAAPDRAVLSRLLAACENYNMDGIDEAMAEINRYEYESDLTVWLNKSAARFDFAEIRKLLIETDGGAAV